MDATTNDDANKVLTNGTKPGTDVSGWLFRFIQEGWLRKRWRKRWCIVKQDRLFLYEFEPSNQQEDKECGTIELEYYQKCVLASKKESKKSPNTFVMELTQHDEANKTKQKEKTKNKFVPQREMFYTENDSDIDRWIAHLNDKIASARLGYAKALDHVTKSRPKPSSSQRRPPTRNHLRERAVQSQLLTDFIVEEEETKKEPVKRGHVPSAAIKPPPGAAKPKLDRIPSTSSEKLLTPTSPTEKLPSTLIPPKPPLKPKTSDGSETSSDGSNSSAQNSKSPPLTPSKALKPKFVSNKQSEDVTESTSDKEEPGVSPPSAPSKALKPKPSSTEDTKEDDSELNKKTPGTPPPTPSKALKPKLSSSEEIKEDESGRTKVTPGTPPPAPSKALKPKILNLLVEEPITEEEQEELKIEDETNEAITEDAEVEKILVAEEIVQNQSDEDDSSPYEKEPSSPPPSPVDSANEEEMKENETTNDQKDTSSDLSASEDLSLPDEHNSTCDDAVSTKSEKVDEFEPGQTDTESKNSVDTKTVEINCDD